MREILYLQAGNLSNHIGTHFWNTQESYFDLNSGSDASEDDPLIWHDISFREGVDKRGDPTYCPRVLVFDQKENFGSLARDALVGAADSSNEQSASLVWSGSQQTIRQPDIAPSRYQMQLGDENKQGTPVSDYRLTTDSVRYWSDYNRVYYIPRSLQMLPQSLVDWNSLEANWELGQKTFAKYDEEHELLEGPVRQFLEECNSVQGFQMTCDVQTFGSFTASLLTGLHDEAGGAKLSSLVFPILSSIQSDAPLRRRHLVNEAKFLINLRELTSFAPLLSHPSSWPRTSHTRTSAPLPSGSLDGSFYETSAILSAHLETITTPLCLKNTAQSLGSFTSSLNTEGVTPLGELSGTFGHSSDMKALDARVFEFSPPVAVSGRHYHARWDVTRGFPSSIALLYEKQIMETKLFSSRAPQFSHSAAYSLPSSYPAFFVDRETEERENTVQVVTSVACSTNMSEILATYARGIEAEVKTAESNSDSTERDELKELANDLWGMSDNYGGIEDLEE